MAWSWSWCQWAVLVMALCGSLMVDLCTEASKVTFKDCGSSAKVNFVDITPCSGGPRSCNISPDTNASITIDFTPDSSRPSLRAECAYMAYGAVVDVPLNDSDACHHGVTCPLPQGQAQHFFYSVYVTEAFPKLSVVVRWKLEDDSNQTMVCIEVNISIVGKKRLPFLRWYDEGPPIKDRL